MPDTNRESPEVTTERALRGAYRMFRADRPRAVLEYLEEALAADPLCHEALVMAGDTWSLDQQALGVEMAEGDTRALAYYDRAIAAQPDLSEAYAEKSRTLFNLAQYQEALACLDQGLAVFDHRPNIDLPREVRVNIGETLYRFKARALNALGRAAEGRRALAVGLARFPGSDYLTSITPEFLPPLESDAER